MLLWFIYQEPFIALKLDNEHGNWVIKDIYYEDWAKEKKISIGDTVLKVNDTAIDDNKIYIQDQGIRAARKLTLLKQAGDIVDVKVNHLDLPKQLFIQLIIPACYAGIVFILALYLYKRKGHEQTTFQLILLMLCLAMAYVSLGVANRLNYIGLMMNGIFSLLTCITAIYYLKAYFSKEKMAWLYFKNHHHLYILVVVMMICDSIVMFNRSFIHIRYIIFASFICILGSIILYLLIKGYFTYRLKKLKFLLYIILSPILLFITLYIMPFLFLKRHLATDDIAMMGILFIPFGLTFMALTDRLENLNYYINRLRYYSMFSFISAVIFTTAIFLVSEGTMQNYMQVCLLLFFGQLLFLYCKEMIDFKERKVIFTTKKNYIHQLYGSVNRIGLASNRTDLFHRLKYELSLKLTIQDVEIMVVNDENSHKQFNHLSLGEMKKIKSDYFTLLNKNSIEKYILRFSTKNKRLNLTKEELLWVELLTLYVNNFIENMRIIEELLSEIASLKNAQSYRGTWIDKLLWSMFEKEKKQLAQELHDTVLQEQLHLVREIGSQINDSAISIQQIERIREQLLDASHELRAYCENLNPPLLTTRGLDVALDKLIKKIKMRANFMLITEIERLLIEDEVLNLVIYRLMQELFNNAIKHSDATSVTIKLYQEDSIVQLLYEDNGIGCKDVQVHQKSNSMGLRGMMERVHAFNGTFTILSEINKGMKIHVKIPLGEGFNDTNFINR